jgi:hypothetical protein
MIFVHIEHTLTSDPRRQRRDRCEYHSLRHIDLCRVECTGCVERGQRISLGVATADHGNSVRPQVRRERGDVCTTSRGNQSILFPRLESGHRWYHIVSVSVLDLPITKTPPRGPCAPFVSFGNGFTPPSGMPTFTNVSLAVLRRLDPRQASCRLRS